MQRIILRQLKASVHRLQGLPAPEITRYYQAYKREFRKYEKISNKNELLRAVKKADIVFGADFHPFAQSQRTHLRILRGAVKNQRPVILALEAIDSSHQKFVDQFQNGEIDDKAFLKRINYSHSWGFPWENYKVLFDFARDSGVPIRGINQSFERQPVDGKRGDLSLRDAHSARLIAQLKKNHPGSLIYVIYGDLHMASSHLPRMTRKCLGKNDHSRFLTIFQNSESLYWRLAERKLEERVDVLKLRPDAYCVVNSPPWMKWQAYLHFLEQTIDADGRDIEDYNDNVHHFVRLVREVWGVEGSFNDFHVYTHGDVKLAAHLSRLRSRKDAAKIETLIKLGRSFFVPVPPTFYLESFGVNHVATLAGQYIHAKLRREKAMHFDFPRDFTAQIWIETVGFFASKLINPRRKFNTIYDLPSRHNVTLLVLEQRLLDQMALKSGRVIKTVKRNKKRRTQDYLEGARTIGALLGNKMYKAFRSGQLDQKILHRWLATRIESKASFDAFYVDVLASLRNIPVGVRSKNERL